MVLGEKVTEFIGRPFLVWGDVIVSGVVDDLTGVLTEGLHGHDVVDLDVEEEEENEVENDLLQWEIVRDDHNDDGDSVDDPSYHDDPSVGTSSSYWCREWPFEWANPDEKLLKYRVWRPPMTNDDCARSPPA